MSHVPDGIAVRAKSLESDSKRLFLLKLIIFEGDAGIIKAIIEKSFGDVADLVSGSDSEKELVVFYAGRSLIITAHLSED